MGMRSRWLRACAALALAIVLVGCGDDDDEPAQTGDVPDESSTSSSVDEAVEPTELAITGTEYEFDFGGVTEVPAGPLEMTLTNEGQEEHQAALMRLNDGETLDTFGAAAASDPTGLAALALVEGFGGPNSAGPGDSVTSSSVVTEGDYVFLCFIPAPDGVAHAEKGMISPFTVTAGEEGAEDAELDAPDGEITLADFSFDVGDDFTGDGTFAVVNEGEQPHEIGSYRLADGATADDVLAFFTSTEPPTGPPPITPAGGIVAVAPGSTGTVQLSYEPGSYVFLCLIPDVADGAPHMAKGMIQEVQVE